MGDRIRIRPLKSRLGVGAICLAVATLIGVTGAATPATASAQAGNIYNQASFPNAKCIGINNTGVAGDWNCTSNPDQTWYWGPAFPNTGFRVLANGNGKCLDTAGGSVTLGTKIVAATCLGVARPDQYWGIVNGDGFCARGEFRLVNWKGVATGTVDAVGVAGGSMANGAQLVLWTEVNHEDQCWQSSIF